MQIDIPLGLEQIAQGRDTLTTNEAARAINRAPQTLRKWASQENGPIRPIRINGRLAWKVSDLAQILTGFIRSNQMRKSRPVL